MLIKFLNGSSREVELKPYANLGGADLRNANLSYADLRNAILSGADLSAADLRNAVLSSAILRNADFRNADLSGAILRNADLRYTSLRGAKLPHFQICPEVGSFRAFKQVYVHRTGKAVIEIEIARTAQRTSSLIGRKCRASKIRVLPGQVEGQSPTSDRPITYTPGAVIEVADFDPDIRVECTRGIHFFMTKQEAEEY